MGCVAGMTWVGAGGVGRADMSCPGGGGGGGVAGMLCTGCGGGGGVGMVWSCANTEPASIIEPAVTRAIKGVRDFIVMTPCQNAWLVNGCARWGRDGMRVALHVLRAVDQTNKTRLNAASIKAS